MYEIVSCVFFGLGEKGRNSNFTVIKGVCPPIVIAALSDEPSGNVGKGNRRGGKGNQTFHAGDSFMVMYVPSPHC